MFSRCWSVFSLAALLLISSSSSVHAAVDDKTRLGNDTIERTVQLRTHSLYAPYIDQDLQNRWWDFGADAYINTAKHVRLTRAKPSQMGWLWSRLPLTAFNFVIEVEFKIWGDSGHIFGDGLAIWLTKERTQPGPIFGNKDNFEGLGIFLDTYANARHSYSFPRIDAMLGDGKTSYDFANDGNEKLSIGSCSANYRRTNVATKLKITYLQSKFLDVKVQYKAWDEWTDCFRIDNFRLPLNPYLGFSALTGEVFDAHDIITVSTYSAVLSSPEAKLEKIKLGASTHRGVASSSTWTGFFFKLLLFIGVCAGGFFGYQEYKRRNPYRGGGGGFNIRAGGGGNRQGGFGGLYEGNKRF